MIITILSVFVSLTFLYSFLFLKEPICLSVVFEATNIFLIRNFTFTFQKFAGEGLRTLCLAYKDLDGEYFQVGQCLWVL